MALHHGFFEQEITTILDSFEKVRNPSLRIVLKLADLSVDNSFEEVAMLDKELVGFGFSRDEITELIGMISCALYMVNLANSLNITTDQKFLDIIENATV